MCKYPTGNSPCAQRDFGVSRQGLHWEKDLRPNKHGMATSTLSGTGLFIALFVFLGGFLSCFVMKGSQLREEDKIELRGEKKKSK